VSGGPDRVMDRARYEQYAAAFNARDYDRVFDFYVEQPQISFFGVHIRSRADLKRFYAFLHSYLVETIRVEKFAASTELVAVEASVRVEGIRDLDRATLEVHGYGGLHPLRAGEVQEMRQYIHYHLQDGRFVSVGCAMPLP
jgi:hypothetical protein